ncbi:MAG TPA: hypothetical protein VM324_12400 [Egibacteraceae bacterium]|nr:hypothetical protein [Egibacteraceae bacterium]
MPRLSSFAPVLRPTSALLSLLAGLALAMLALLPASAQTVPPPGTISPPDTVEPPATTAPAPGTTAPAPGTIQQPTRVEAGLGGAATPAHPATAPVIAAALLVLAVGAGHLLRLRAARP